jgi:hypothetical protein
MELFQMDNSMDKQASSHKENRSSQDECQGRLTWNSCTLIVLLSSSVMNTVAEPAVGSTLPKEGLCRPILNCSVSSMILSSVIATASISEVEPGLIVKFLIPPSKSPEREREMHGMCLGGLQHLAKGG